MKKVPWNQDTGPPLNPSVRMKSNLGGRWKEASGPEKAWVTLKPGCQGRAWLWREGSESVVSEVLEELPFRLLVLSGEWSVLNQRTSLKLRNWHLWMDLQTRKQGSPTNAGPLGPLPCVSHNPIRLHLSRGPAASEMEWGENRREASGYPSGWRRPPTFRRRTGCTGIRDALPCSRQLCSTYMNL